KAQNARQRALKDFASGAVRILVATDIPARGSDVADISHAVNFELPDDAVNYVHRICRTGRNGASGVATTLCDGGERRKLREVERLIRRTLPVTGDVPAPSAEPVPRHIRNEAQRKNAGSKRPSTPRPQRANGERPAGSTVAPQPWWERETGTVAPRG